VANGSGPEPSDWPNAANIGVITFDKKNALGSHLRETIPLGHVLGQSKYGLGLSFRQDRLVGDIRGAALHSAPGSGKTCSRRRSCAPARCQPTAQRPRQSYESISRDGCANIRLNGLQETTLARPTY
jgi:hypothetical protein